MKLLDDILIIDFSQFLSAPSASLRLADLGARVIKIEKPGIGDIGRTLYVSDTEVNDISTIFHAINRNKESFQADLKNEAEFEQIKKLIKKADVIIHNFRPGVMKRIGLSYEDVKRLNPSIVYATINGYSELGEWKSDPGQDLLLQAVSGITWLNGNEGDGPIPMGISAADILAGTHLTQGILAALLKRAVSDQGALVEVSMLESLMDFQFELMTCFLNDGNKLPVRSEQNNGNAYIAAPYGIYKLKNGFIALAMEDIPQLGALLQCVQLSQFNDPKEWFNQRNDIKKIIQDNLKDRNVDEVLGILEPADIWCSKVLNYDMLVKEDAYKVLDMEQDVILSNGEKLLTTRCPIRIDGELLKSPIGAPDLGQHTEAIIKEFDL